VTLIQFVQSLLFAVVALGLLVCRPPGATSVVIGWFTATALSTMLAIPWLRQWISSEPVDRANPDRGGFWPKLLPFALWMWVTNLLSNLFEVIDRFMIVHLSGWPAEEALHQVGNYHSSRILPLLFVSVAVMLGSMITPHLSVDWEVGRREAVVRRLNFVLKCLLVSLVAASVLVLFGAPSLFELGFRNKFAGGLAVLPWTLIYCTWFGALAVAQNYLWCAERAGLASLPLLVGLLTNVVCQILLLPRFGLHGAVWSTTIANFTALVLLYRLSSWQGMQVDRGTWLLTLLPLAIAMGRWTALAAVVGVAIVAISNDRLFSAAEKREIADTFSRATRRLKAWLDPRTRQLSKPV
jgi:O-antigen/teichoic acid export membrane protein